MDKEELKNKDSLVLLPGALIKFGKKEFMEKMLYEGEIRFSVASTFKNEESGNNINDSYEGNLFYEVSNLYIAPIINEENHIYGKTRKLADNAKVRITNGGIQEIPFACFYGYPNKAMNCGIKIDNYDEIISSNDRYDAAVIIFKPIELIKFLEEKESVYFNWVKYVDKTPTEKEIKNELHCIYYKRKKYVVQNEFRIALQNLKAHEPFNMSFGAFTDFAYLVPIEMLKKGFIICDSVENTEKIKKQVEENGQVKIGEFKTLDKISW